MRRLRQTPMLFPVQLVLLFVLCLGSCGGKGAPSSSGEASRHEQERPETPAETELEQKGFRKGIITVSDEEIRILTEKAESGDKNAAAKLYLYYHYSTPYEKKAAHFLNIAGRGGPGVGQYGIANYEEYDPETQRMEKGGGWMSDNFLLSEELILMLQAQVRQGDGDAAFRLYQYYRFCAKDHTKKNRYLALAAKLGNETALQSVDSILPTWRDLVKE